MASGSSLLEVDTPAYQIASSSSNHGNHTEDEAKKLVGTPTLRSNNTLVTLTYTVESQVDEGVADLGTCYHDAVTTVIVDPDESVTYAKVKTTPTSVVGAGTVAEGDTPGVSPHYICQSCSRLTPLDSCYCTHCGRKRGRGRPKGVTGPKGAVVGRVLRTAASKQDGSDEQVVAVTAGSPSSSPAAVPRGAQTSTPSRQMNHKPLVPIFHRGKPSLGKKSRGGKQPATSSPDIAKGVKDDDGPNLSSSVDQLTNDSPPTRYLSPVTTAIVTIPVCLEEGDSLGCYGNTEGLVPSCNATPSQSSGSNGDVGMTETRTRDHSLSVQHPYTISSSFQHTPQPIYGHHSSEHSSPSANFPQGSSAPSAEGTPVHDSQLSQGSSSGPCMLPHPLQPYTSRPSHQAPPPTSTPHTQNTDLVTVHADIPMPSPHTVMTIGSQKDTQVIFQGRWPGEEVISGHASNSAMLGPTYHMTSQTYVDHQTSRHNQSSPSHYQVINPQSFVQSARGGGGGVMGCSPGTYGPAYQHLQWTQHQAGGAARYERGGPPGTAQSPGPTTRIQLLPLGLKAGGGERNVAPPPGSLANEWAQTAWMLPSTHVGWPHPYPIHSPSSSMNFGTAADASSSNAKATPLVSSGGGAGGWNESQEHPPGRAFSPAHRYAPFNGTVCGVGGMEESHQHTAVNSSGCKSQEDHITLVEDRPVKMRRLDTEDGGVVSRGCVQCCKVLEQGFYQCTSCKENYQLAALHQQLLTPSPVLLSTFVNHLQDLCVLEQVVSAIASEQLQARLSLKKAEEEYQVLEVQYDDVVHKRALKAKELSNLTAELQKLMGNVGTVSCNADTPAN